MRVVARALGASRARPRCAALEELEERIARHRGNLREVLFELYDEAELSARSSLAGRELAD